MSLERNYQRSFIGNTIIKSIEKYAPVSVINITNNSVSLKNHILSVSPISEYNLYHLNLWNDNIDNRIKILDSQIDFKDLNEEESVNS